MSVTNIAAYQFAPLTDLKQLREHLLKQCKAWKLKGTILLSPEGINLFVAGSHVEIDRLVAELHALPGLESLTPKYSESENQPFTRMLVRIKKEIIAFGVQGIDPSRHTSPKLSARTLRQWLDEGRAVTLLDTRNNYEVKLGTFQGAHSLDIDHFKQLPAAVKALPETLKQQPIVMFCTGGIRCEKAGPFMEREGFQNIFQLDGGILKYFEECGGKHYEGECFVFDQRVGVDPALQETSSAQCFRCQSPLTKEEQGDERYVPRVSCPHCFKTDEQLMAETIAAREMIIRHAINPLPGSIPCNNYRPFNVPAEFDQSTLLELLCKKLHHVPREEWIIRCEKGLLCGKNHEPVDAAYRIRAGERFYFLEPAQTEPEVDANLRILHEDTAILVLHKPAPLPMHPGGRFNRNTLQSILDRVYAPEKPRPAHRLDANTTGLLVCARTQHFARLLQPQFEEGTVEKRYLARVQGYPQWDHFACHAPISVQPVNVGAREVDHKYGLAAHTEFVVRERFTDGTTLLEARPFTGRTNQIRIHLCHLGLPILGDQTYLTKEVFASIQTLSLSDPPLCLHAWKISFNHPKSQKRLDFETAFPPWADADFQYHR